MDILKRNLSLRLCNVQQVVMALKFRTTRINILNGVICCILHTIIYANINCAVFLHQSHVVAIYCAIFVLDIPVASANCWAKLAVLKIGNLQAALQHFTRRPASADRTARRQFQATGQPVNRTQVTQASDAMTSRLPRYKAKCVPRRCFQCGSVPLRSDIKGTELPPANNWSLLQVCLTMSLESTS